MNNKKAIASINYLVWILRFIFLAILMVSIGLVVSKYINVRVDVSSIESAIFLERIFSSNAIMFQDSVTLRVYPGIVELEKFKNKQTLDDEFAFAKGSRHISSKVRLEKTKNTVFVGKRLFEDLEPTLGTIFGSDAYELKQDFIASVRDNNEIADDKLSIQVLQLK